MAKSSNGNKLTQIIMMKTFNFTQLPSIGRNSTLLAYISIQLPPPPKASQPSDHKRISKEVSGSQIIHDCSNPLWKIHSSGLQGMVPTSFEVLLHYFYVMQIDKASKLGD